MRSSPAGPSDGRGLGGRRRDPGRRRGLLSLASAACGRVRRPVDPRRGVVAPRRRSAGRSTTSSARRSTRRTRRGRRASSLRSARSSRSGRPPSRATDARCVSPSGSPASVPGACPGAQSRVVPLPAAHVVAGGRTTTAPTVSIAVVPRVPAVAVAARDPAYRRQTGIPPAGFSPSPSRPRGARRRCCGAPRPRRRRPRRDGAPWRRACRRHRGGRVRARRSAPAGVAGPAEPGPAAGGRAPRAGGEDARRGRAGHERRPCGLVASTA